MEPAGFSNPSSRDIGFEDSQNTPDQGLEENYFVNPARCHQNHQTPPRQSLSAMYRSSGPTSDRSNLPQVFEDHPRIQVDGAKTQRNRSNSQTARPSVETLLNPATPLSARTRPIASPQAIATSRNFASAVPLDTNYPDHGSSHLGKRPRGDTSTNNQELNISAPPSKRATPDPFAHRAAPQMSRTTSHSSSSLGLDDTELDTFAEIYGFDPREDKKRFKLEQQAQREMMEVFHQPGNQNSEKLRQEQADEEMARRLQAEINNSPWMTDGSASTPNLPSAFTDTTSFRSANRPAESPQFQPNLPFPSLNSQEDNILRNSTNGRTLSYDPYEQQALKSTDQNNLDSTQYNGWDDELEIIDGTNFKPNNSRFQSSPHSGRYGGVESVDLTDLTSSAYTNYSRGYNLAPTAVQRGHLSTPSRSVYGNKVNDLLSYKLSPSGTGFLSVGSSTLGNGFGMTASNQTTRIPWSRNDNRTPSTSSGYDEASFDRVYGLYTNTGETDNAEALKDLLNNIRPDEEDNLGASERGDGTPESMAENANLYKYQQKGLAWLSKMEEGTNKGSILADDMGLGKTIQAIALMVSRKSPDPNCKTTLIIAPVALLRQWESEVQNKLKKSHQLTTLVYHGSAKSTITYSQIKTYDVVITTYGTLTADHKKKIELAKKLRDVPNYAARATELPMLTGDQCKFYRCILDEAQNIKNKSAKSSLAAYEVNAKHRLCMTGTPMMNNVVELFSLVHFLRIQPYCQWEKFNLDFARPLRTGTAYGRDGAMRKLQALCKAIMLRRTKKSKMDGKPLVQLPDRHMEEVHAIFDDDEQAFYSALEAKTQLTFNKFLKAGTVGRNYSNMLTLLLRLRQACCHPHLIRDFAIAVEAAPETLLDNARELPPHIVQRIIENGITDCPICMDTADNYTIFNPCGHSTCTECFCGLSDSSINPNITQSESAGVKSKFRCHACRGDTDPAKVTDYVHFKKLYEPEKALTEGLGGLPDSFECDSASSSEAEEDESAELSDSQSLKDFIVDDDAPVEEADQSDGEGSDVDLDETKQATLGKLQCPSVTDDKGILSPTFKRSKTHAVESGSDEESHKLSEYRKGRTPFEKASGKSAEPAGNKRKKYRNTQKKQEPRKTLAQLKKEGMRNAASRKKYFKRLAKDFIPSAKISKCLEILRRIMRASDPEKVIVFSQFTSLLDLLEVPMNTERWTYRRFDGSMDATSRNKSVVDFTSNPTTRILLVSLKAGNAGLNLTAASHVIILDPFWNPYIEEQAIDRAHRIGQRRAVHVHRILVAETVEDRILQLQQKKRDLIEGALDEGASNTIGRLGVRELGFLFGINN